MSRRWQSYQPAAGVRDAELTAMRYGTRTYADRPMPGCHERCCFPMLCPGRLPAELEIAKARLDWQLSGFDLIPLISMLLGWALAVGLAARGMGL